MQGKLNAKSLSHIGNFRYFLPRCLTMQRDFESPTVCANREPNMRSGPTVERVDYLKANRARTNSANGAIRGQVFCNSFIFWDRSSAIFCRAPSDVTGRFVRYLAVPALHELPPDSHSFGCRERWGGKSVFTVVPQFPGEAIVTRARSQSHGVAW